MSIKINHKSADEFRLEYPMMFDLDNYPEHEKFYNLIEKIVDAYEACEKERAVIERLLNQEIADARISGMREAAKIAINLYKDSPYSVRDFYFAGLSAAEKAILIVAATELKEEKV